MYNRVTLCRPEYFDLPTIPKSTIKSYRVVDYETEKEIRNNKVLIIMSIEKTLILPMTPAFNSEIRVSVDRACSAWIFKSLFNANAGWTMLRLYPAGRESMSFHYYLLRKIDHPEFLTFLSTSHGERRISKAAELRQLLAWFITCRDNSLYRSSMYTLKRSTLITNIINICLDILCKQFKFKYL